MSGGVVPFPQRDGASGGPTAERTGLAQVNSPGGGLKKTFQASTKTKAEWKRESQRREDPGYSARWSVFWINTVRAVAALGRIGATELTYIDEYVRRVRLAEVHLYEAQQNPYAEYNSGYVAVHPGFGQARAEVKLANAIAKDLGLTPAIRRAAGIDTPQPGAESASGLTDDQADL